MLHLTRKEQESVVVGGSNGFERLLKVTVLGIEDGTVRLGFEVGRGVFVYGAELWDQLQIRDQFECGTPDPAGSQVQRF